ncbi:uncharacterized protein LOC110601984 [Manihot esculenta]|uniref:uncharacterized protein LOC110601984 n=1 Tax=Manihot esculenta TaxID=3983 RepID=UPI000B5D10C8|nr:uncharacterized protein LOC110601984 [Manihot esculenta]
MDYRGINNHEEAANMMDLTLKLGLPNENNNQSQIWQDGNVVPTTPCLANFCFPGPYTALLQGESNSYGMSSGGGQVATGGNPEMTNVGGSSNPNGGQNFINANQEVAWPEQEAEMRDLNSSLVDPAFNPMPGLSFMNSNTVLDSSSRKVKDDGDESGNSSAGKQVSRRQRYGSFVEPNKRCTNNNCNTTDTPMWRKGPLGPKI